MDGKLKVTALADFYDKQEGVARKAGETFEVTPERLEQLNACGPEQCGKPLAKALCAPKAERKAGDGKRG